VPFVFGIVGDGINAVIEALRKRQDRIRYIGVRHEEAAAFMASGFAKLTGKLGVCLGTTGPGAVHLLNGLYDAHYDGAPVLAITGTTFHDLSGVRFMQSVDTKALMQDVASQLRAAADILNRGRKVAILVGQGALRAREEVLAVAEKLAAPVAKALLGKAVIPDDSPHSVGGIGHLGTQASEWAMHQCDTVLILGSTMPWIDSYPKPGSARGVQVDLKADRIGLRFPVDVGLVGGVKQTLTALLPMLTQKSDRAFLADAQSRLGDWNALLHRVCVVGDGGFAQLMAELTTAVQHQLPVKIVVLKNNSLAEVKFEQRELGNTEYGCDLSPIDFVAFARACGADGFRCAKPSEVRSAVANTLRSPRAALLEAVVDGNEPPAKPGQLRA
jgi:thiamine pyrophosphate-dependent acetolactate synthase large subunit-like protein